MTGMGSMALLGRAQTAPGTDATEASPALPGGVLVPDGHLPNSRDVKETNLVLRLGASEVIQRFISLLGQGRGQMPNYSAPEAWCRVSGRLGTRTVPSSQGEAGEPCNLPSTL